MTTTHYQQVGKVIEKYYPDIYKEVLPAIAAPKPVFRHTIFLPALLDLFCQYKQINRSAIVGLKKGTESNDLKRLFVAVIINLYNPEALTGIHGDKVKERLCSELAALLGCLREQISQDASGVKRLLNPDKNLGMYGEYKKEVDNICKALEQRAKEERSLIKFD